MGMKNTWTIKGGRTLGPAPFLIAGIVNVTPDSFFDGGRHDGVQQAVAHGRALFKQGAHILDVGGESTRPGAEPVSLEEELRRVIPVVQGLVSPLGADGPVVAVDTYKAEVARQALLAGADIINDVSACRFDPALLEVVGQEKPGYVLMHALGNPKEMQSNPQYDNVVDAIVDFFEKQLVVLTNAGLPEQHIALDPGIGFGKTPQHNVSILRHIDRLAAFGLPVYLGLSNKSVWGALLNLGLSERTNATVAATALSFSNGAWVHRVHDVAAAHQALTVAAQLDKQAEEQ